MGNAFNLPRSSSEPTSTISSEEYQWRREIVRRASQPSAIQACAPRKLIRHLCKQSIFLDNYTKKLWVEQGTMKACISISATALDIHLLDEPACWVWDSLHPAHRDGQSFEVAARLIKVQWFEVKGKMDCRCLSPETKYSVWFRIKFSELDDWHGWDESPAIFRVDDGENSSESARHIFSLNKPLKNAEMTMTPYRFLRKIGWFEFEAGSFTVNRGRQQLIQFSMTQLSYAFKQGILLESVRILPSGYYYHEDF